MLDPSLSSLSLERSRTGTDAPPTFTYTTENQNIRIHMSPDPVTQVCGGKYKVGMTFVIVQPIVGIVAGVLVYNFIPLADAPLAGTWPLFPLFASCTVAVFASAFPVIVGIAYCMWAHRVACEQADILITPETLSITTSGRTPVPQEYSWPRNQIAAITNGPTQFGINSQYTLQLDIRLHDGETTSLFKHRNPANLQWLAETLQLTINLP